MIKEINADRLEDPSCAFTQDGDKVAIKQLMVGGICIYSDHISIIVIYLSIQAFLMVIRHH
jgi:hypothetical protein